MDVRARVGLNLQELRKAKRLSREELAHRARIHQTYLSDLERGKRNPSVLVLDRLAQGLEVDVSALFRLRTLPT
jgi:transcriptional regulator with XRE-family HTH domain